MKKIALFGVIALLAGIGLAGTFWGASIASAASSVWNSCPRGIVNDPYPGLCGSYIDTNRDRICDRSQPNPAAAQSQSTGSPTRTVTATPQAVAAAISPSTSGPEAPAGQTADAGLINAAAVAGAAPAVASNIGIKGLGNSYNFILILIVLAVLYAFTWVLSLKRKISTVIHRRIWNLVLLAAILVSALLGLVLILRLDFGIKISLPFNMLFWHVEAGIALAIVAVFHVLWHWRYFAKMLAVKPVEKPDRIKGGQVGEARSGVTARDDGASETGAPLGRG
jgi:hypothetical protein